VMVVKVIIIGEERGVIWLVEEQRELLSGQMECLLVLDLVCLGRWRRL
jgi:hypothetical protein